MRFGPSTTSGEWTLLCFRKKYRRHTNCPMGSGASQCRRSTYRLARCVLLIRAFCRGSSTCLKICPTNTSSGRFCFRFFFSFEFLIELFRWRFVSASKGPMGEKLRLPSKKFIGKPSTFKRFTISNDARIVFILIFCLIRSPDQAKTF